MVNGTWVSPSCRMFVRKFPQATEVRDPPPSPEGPAFVLFLPCAITGQTATRRRDPRGCPARAALTADLTRCRQCPSVKLQVYTLGVHFQIYVKIHNLLVMQRKA